MRLCYLCLSLHECYGFLPILPCSQFSEHLPVVTGADRSLDLVFSDAKEVEFFLPFPNDSVPYTPRLLPCPLTSCLQDTSRQ